MKISSPHGKTCRKVKIFSFFYFREIGMMEEIEVGQEKGGKRMDVMKLANSLPMWIGCGIPVVFVMI